MKRIVKRFGHGLHITLPKSEFREEEEIEIFHKTELEKLIDERIEYKLKELKGIDVN